MFVLKVIFVILLSLPVLIMAVMLLNKLFDSALKYKEKKPVDRESRQRKRQKRR